MITAIRGGLEVEIFKDLNATLQLDDINATQHGGIYDCVIINMAGFDVATSILYVEPHFVEHPEDVMIDQGESFNLSCQAESFPDSVYHWEVFDEAMGVFVELGVNGSMLAFTEVEYEEFGEYRCVATATEIDRRTDSFSAIVTGKNHQ